MPYNDIVCGNEADSSPFLAYFPYFEKNIVGM
jgi:hypothetical protein